MTDLPFISVVTPTLNQGRFIERTLLSLKRQVYRNFEHIIVDGGSTDNTLQILEKYEGTYNMVYISEEDEGQSDAINKGFLRSSGEILAWLNSDDTYEPYTLAIIADYFQKHPQMDVAYGNVDVIDEFDNVIKRLRYLPLNRYLYFYGVHLLLQPSVFWRRDIFFKVRMLNPKLKQSMDYDLFMRFILYGARFGFISKTLSNYRVHPSAKTVMNPHLKKREKEYVRRINLGIQFSYPCSRSRELAHRIVYDIKPIFNREIGYRYYFSILMSKPKRNVTRLLGHPPFIAHANMIRTNP